jgi:hypothetical protein
MRPPAGIAESHMDPREPVRGVTDSAMLGELPAEAIGRLVAVAGPDSGSTLTVAELRHLGGALRRGQPGHGALATLDASFMAFGVGKAFDEHAARASTERLAQLSDALAPYGTGRRCRGSPPERASASCSKTCAAAAGLPVTATGPSIDSR